MNTIVMKMGKDDLQNLIKALTRQQVNNNNPYVTFAAKVKGVTVLVYTSGKVVFQGANAETIAEQFGYQSANHSTSDTVSGQNIPLIGSDEVGNGSYFGGLAVVASFVTPDDHALLKKLGVDDSKNLTDSKIRQIAPVLENNIKHKALLLSPQKYNQVVGKGKMHNAVSVKVALHNQAIYLLLQDGVKPEKIVIDAFTSRQNYQKYLKNEA
ncbi:ribonuclease HIII, partial [Streptococcus gallolyticus]